MRTTKKLIIDTVAIPDQLPPFLFKDQRYHNLWTKLKILSSEILNRQNQIQKWLEKVNIHQTTKALLFPYKNHPDKTLKHERYFFHQTQPQLSH